MLLLPAVDIQDGCVVRLSQGNLKHKTVYSRDPLKAARHWVKQGAQMLHVVDLDGASTGTPKNIEAVKAVIKGAGIPVQFGGGVRTMDTIETLVSAGAARVVLGTKAVQDAAFLKKARTAFGDKIIVSIDAKAGVVQVEGWQETRQGLAAIDFALSLKEAGFSQIIYTDTAKDGMLKGPNIKELKALLKATGLSVIASGGVSSLDDIRRLRELQSQGVQGVIIGKALYEGKFTLVQALKIA